jgi:virginiamycin A acetyltransferase
MSMNGPSAEERYPMKSSKNVCFLKNIIKSKNIIVGDYTYCHSTEHVESFEENVLYHYPFFGDRLIIGKFCALASNCKFIMNGANHKLSGISTYPFQIFGCGWERVMPPLDEMPIKGDTVVGNDVWIGYDALTMPGVHIGNGAIVASRSVVVKDVPAFSIVGGNPAQVVKMRFSDEEIEMLERVAWWDWPLDKITRNLELIVASDVHALADAQ